MKFGHFRRNFVQEEMDPEAVEEAEWVVEAVVDKRFKLGDEAQTLVECGGEIGIEYEVKWWGWVSRSGFLPSRLTHLSKGLKKPLRAAMHDVGASISPSRLRRSGRGLRECAVLPRPSRHRRRGVARRPHRNGYRHDTVLLPSGLHSSQGAGSLLTGLSKKDLGTHLGVQDKQVKAWEEGALESGPAIPFSTQHDVLRLYQQHWRDARRLAMLREGGISVASTGSRAVKGFHPLGTRHAHFSSFRCRLRFRSLRKEDALCNRRYLRGRGRFPLRPEGTGSAGS